MFSLEDSENMQECHMSQNLRHEVKAVEKHYGMTVGHELQCSHITFINHRVTVLYYIKVISQAEYELSYCHCVLNYRFRFSMKGALFISSLHLTWATAITGTRIATNKESFWVSPSGTNLDRVSQVMLWRWSLFISGIFCCTVQLQGPLFNPDIRMFVWNFCTCSPSVHLHFLQVLHLIRSKNPDCRWNWLC